MNVIADTLSTTGPCVKPYVSNAVPVCRESNALCRQMATVCDLSLEPLSLDSVESVSRVSRGAFFVYSGLDGSGGCAAFCVLEPITLHNEYMYNFSSWYLPYRGSPMLNAHCSPCGGTCHDMYVHMLRVRR